MKRWTKIWLVMLCIATSMAIWMPKDADVASIRSKIKCEYIEEGTVKVTGTGILQWEHLEKLAEGEEVGAGIEKVIIDEGITGIDSYCFSTDFTELNAIEFPSTLRTIGKKAFKGCSSLKKVKLPDGITEIPEGCFEQCEYLKKIYIPDSVTSIQEDAFLGCIRLRKLTLPEDLEEWNDPIADTPMLRKIRNRSQISCELDDCDNNKTWYVGKKKKNKVAPGKTAKARGKKYKIRYKLLGGKRTGDLPTSYEYGTNIELPLDVKKKGYTLLGWHNESETEVYYRTDVSPSLAENITVSPMWVKYKIKNVKSQKVIVTINDSDAIAVFGQFDVRYSLNKDMSDARICSSPSDSRKKVITNLKKNKRYYIEVSYVDLEDEEWKYTWVGKQSIKIKK